MTSAPEGLQTSEVVGLFANRESFERAVRALLAAGFGRVDLSVLASHESLDAAGRSGASWRDAMTALVGELRYEGPLVAAGAIFIASGGLISGLAALIGATLSGVALKDLLDELAARPHTEQFARSLAAGSVILWVRTENANQRASALSILAAEGGSNVHLAASSAEPA